MSDELDDKEHVFSGPTKLLVDAYEAEGMTWAECNADAKRFHAAQVLFHVGTVQVSALDDGARVCRMCGKRSAAAAMAKA